MFKEHSELIILKDNLWLKRQKIAGKAVSSALQNFSKKLASEKNISLKDIESWSVQILKDYNCTPTFLNYEGFPGAVCLSVNENVVHGVPNDYVLQDGDVVTLDLGGTFEGAIADAAFTCIYGTPKSEKHVEMLKLCQESLNAGIDAFEVGKRIGAIGSTIYRNAKNKGFAIIDEYGGHGINYEQPHASPFIANRSHGNEGVIVQKGMSIAIEPMLVMGDSNKTKTLDDDWTIKANGISCHFEHSVTIDQNGEKHIITEHNMEAGL